MRAGVTPSTPAHPAGGRGQIDLRSRSSSEQSLPGPGARRAPPARAPSYGTWYITTGTPVRRSSAASVRVHGSSSPALPPGFGIVNETRPASGRTPPERPGAPAPPPRPARPPPDDEAHRVVRRRDGLAAARAAIAGSPAASSNDRRLRAEDRVAQHPRRAVGERAEVRLEAERHRAPVADRLVDHRRAAAQRLGAVGVARDEEVAGRRRREPDRRRGAVRAHHVARVPERVRGAADAAGQRAAPRDGRADQRARRGDPVLLRALERRRGDAARRRPAPRRRASRRSGRRPRPRSGSRPGPRARGRRARTGPRGSRGSIRRVAVGDDQHVGVVAARRP